MEKTILLASFIPKEEIEKFLEYLEVNFNIEKTKVFCYKNLNNESKVIVTFKLLLVEGKRLNLKQLFANATPIHKKGDALYTINALNKLIDQTIGDSLGNIDYKAVKIDWDTYQNKLIIINREELVILPISRIF